MIIIQFNTFNASFNTKIIALKIILQIRINVAKKYNLKSICLRFQTFYEIKNIF